MDIADLRDAYIGARAAMKEIFAEAYREFMYPDELLKLRLMDQTMPPEVRQALDPETQAQLDRILRR